MKDRLYTVTVVVTAVVAAQDEGGAIDYASSNPWAIVRSTFHSDPVVNLAGEVAREAQLPPGWRTLHLPYGEGHLRRIGEYLGTTGR